MFFWKKKTAGLHHTEDRMGMHQTLHFQSRPTFSNENPSKHQIIRFWRSAAETAACKWTTHCSEYIFLPTICCSFCEVSRQQGSILPPNPMLKQQPFADSEIRDTFYGWWEVDYWIFVACSWILMKMWVLVHPQLGLLCGAALPGAFFRRKTCPSWKSMICMLF